jgi:hypothetical protein
LTSQRQIIPASVKVVDVGANLFQSGFTRLCPLEAILRKFGVRSGGTACT